MAGGWRNPAFVGFGLIYFAIALTLGVMMFLFRELGVPMMFRQGILARPAFRETWRLIWPASRLDESSFSCCASFSASPSRCSRS